MAWESGGDPDEFARQGQTGPMPSWDGSVPPGYPQQDQVPPGYAPPPGATGPGAAGPGYAGPPPGYGPGYGAPGYGAPGYGPPGSQGYFMPGYVPGPGWAPGYFVMPGPQPPTHLARAIVGLFFFWPVAVAAIIMATQVEGKYSRGDYYGSVQASRNARICANIAIWGAVAFFVFFLALAAVIALSAGA